MYPINSSVAALFEAENAQVLRITGTDRNGTAISITDANVMLGGFNIDRYSCNGEKLEVGTAIAAELELKLNNESGAFDSIVFEGAELFVELGVADWTQSNPTVHYIPIGYFTPDEQPRKLTTISLKALDRMGRFDAVPPTLIPWTTQGGDPITDSQGNIIYFVSNVRFPCTVAQLARRAALLCGVPFTQDISALPNANYTIAALPTLQQNITFRNIIQWCAGIMGTCAFIDWNGELQFKWYSAVDYTSTLDKRYSSDLHENDITITGVQYTNTQNVTIVSGTEDYALDMTGNYLAATGIAEILPNVKNKVAGFSYRAFEASVITAPWLWPMDVITFTDKDGVNHSCAVTNVNFGLNGAMALAGKGETEEINKGTAPSGVTKEQGFLIEQATEYAAEKTLENLSQEQIFNLLTNNGETQGLLLHNGKVYLNASYMQTGTLVASLLKAGILRPKSGNTNNYWNMETGEFSLKSDGASNGITYKNGVLDINASNIKAGVLSDAAGVNTWNMQTGDMNVKGSFTATTEIGGDTYKLQLQNDYLGLYINNQLQGYIGWEKDLGVGIHAYTGLSTVLDASVTNSSGELTGGSYVRVNKDGEIVLRGRKITVGAVGELPQYALSGTITFVRDVNFNTSSVTYGSITVVNGIVVDYD